MSTDEADAKWLNIDCCHINIQVNLLFDWLVRILASTLYDQRVAALVVITQAAWRTQYPEISVPNRSWRRCNGALDSAREVVDNSDVVTLENVGLGPRPEDLQPGNFNIQGQRSNIIQPWAKLSASNSIIITLRTAIETELRNWITKIQLLPDSGSWHGQHSNALLHSDQLGYNKSRERSTQVRRHGGH